MDLVQIEENIRKLEENRTDWMISKETIEFIVKYITKHIQDPIVIEIGTHKGYSALNLAKVSKAVLTLEIDPKFYEEATINLEPATNVRIYNGDALKLIPAIRQNGILFNVALIDAKKSEYMKYFQSLVHILQENFVIFVDNTISHREQMKDFLEFLEASELDWQEMGIGQGLIVIKN